MTSEATAAEIASYTPPTKKKRKLAYVNNPTFLQAMIEHRNKCKEHEAAGKPPPQISRYIGECILAIANRLSHKPNFIGYGHREEMVSDAIENCFQYLHNFNPEKSSNPFAYFTQICTFAFIRRIQKEKTQLYTKYKMIEAINVLNSGSIERQGHDTASYDESIKSSEWSQEYMYEFINKYENAKAEKLAKKKQATLDKFLADEETLEEEAT